MNDFNKTITNYAHSKDGEIYIYDSEGKEIALAEYMRQHCELNKDMEVTVNDMLGGELCAGCSGCPMFTLMLACMQVSRLRAEKDKLEATLFAVVRNSIVLPVGMRMGKSQKGITDMTFDTIKELQAQIDYKAVKKIMENENNDGQAK